MAEFDYKGKIASYVKKRVVDPSFGKVLLLENGICVHIYGVRENFYTIEMYDARYKTEVTFEWEDFEYEENGLEKIASAIIDFVTPVYKYWYAHFLDENYKMFGKYWMHIEDWSEPKREFPWIWHPKEK